MTRQADTPGEAADADGLLASGSRCVLAVRTAEGPLASPVPFWFDGTHLWTVANAARLRMRPGHQEPECAVYVPPSDTVASDAISGNQDASHGQTGLRAYGRGRVFGLAEPLGTLLHAPAISAALGALAARQLDRLAGYAQEATRMPPAWFREQRAVLRLTIEETETLAHPRPEGGLTPRLPPAVPAEVRRRLAGRRQVVVAADDEGLAASPALWGGDFTLSAIHGVTLSPGRRVAAVVEAEPDARSGRATGLTLSGRLDDGGRLRPEAASWWHGLEWGHADVTGPPDGGIELPD